MHDIILHIQANIYLIAIGISLLCVWLSVRGKTFDKNSGLADVLKPGLLRLVKVNLIMAVLFGILLSLGVIAGPGDHAYWLMPLVMAPLSFLASVAPVSIPVGMIALFVFFKFKTKSEKEA